VPGKSNKLHAVNPRSAWLTIQQVADELQVDYRTVWAEIHRGNLPAGKVGSVHWRISRESLDAYMRPVTP
jgi:excisionase family DNA binding protein